MIIDYNVKLIVIDSFCGAGGVTEGFHRAVDEYGNKVCKVIIGINHDEKAIESHAANHPDTIHFIEDFTTLDAKRLLPIVNVNRERYPNAKVLFWASAECTNYSKAKGGLPRDADSRTLPSNIQRYVKVLNPDIIGVENVVEFIDWGPLDENGKPIKEEKGTYYRAWRDRLTKLGYLYDFRTLNAADFGAYTSRIRYFGIFAKEANNIAFPVQTHSKNGVNGLLKWNAVKDMLNIDIEGESIFNRKKPLVDATLERIIAGIEKFVVNKAEDVFVSRYNSGRPEHHNLSIQSPCGIITGNDRFAVVKSKFISKAFSGRPENKNQSIDNPAGSITTIDHHHILTAYYGNGYNTSVEEPAGTVTTKDRFALVTSKFIANSYSGGGQISSINNPNPTLLTNPKSNLVSAQWLMNPQFRNIGGSIEKPCFTLIARMDKMPPYLIETKFGGISIQINESDSEIMKRLKRLCNQHGIIDVMMRLLMIDELLRIQGFGDQYILKGTKAQMKKNIGNAVECNQAKVLAEVIARTIHVNFMEQVI